MSAIEIIVIVVSSLTVVSVIAWRIVKRIKNKNRGCSGGCCGCPYAERCRSQSTQDIH